MQPYRWTALVIFLCSCHARLEPRTQTDIASSAPESEIPVVVTDLESKQEISGVKATHNGQITTLIPPGRYTFALTDRTRFAFIERTVSSNERLTLALSSNCQILRGRVLGSIVAPGSIHLWRFIDSIDEKFTAMVNQKGEFQVCLPPDIYCVFIQGGMRSLSVPVKIPDQQFIEIPAYAAADIEQTPKRMQIPTADLPSFASSLSQYKMIGLGEANHGTAEFHSLRGKLSLELARLNGLRLILLEADAIGMMTIDDYALGQSIDLGKAVAALRFWTTDTQEFISFLVGLREFNASRPPGEKVHILGIDAQRLEPPTQFLLDHRDELVVSEQEGALLSRIGPKHGSEFTKLPPEDRSILRSLLERLSSRGDPIGLTGVRARANIAARSILYQLRYLDVVPAVGLRDQAMAELASYIAEESKAPQVALWAHIFHIARQFDYGEKTLGQFLSEKLGDAYFSVGFFSYRGQARAWDRPSKIGVIPHELGPTPSFNIESVVMQALGYPDVAWVRLDRVEGEMARWLSLPRYAREFGWYYDPNEIQVLNDFPAAMGAVVVIQHANASTPTPTGVRKAKN